MTKTLDIQGTVKITRNLIEFEGKGIDRKEAAHAWADAACAYAIDNYAEADINIGYGNGPANSQYVTVGDDYYVATYWRTDGQIKCDEDRERFAIEAFLEDLDEDETPTFEEALAAFRAKAEEVFGILDAADEAGGKAVDELEAVGGDA